MKRNEILTKFKDIAKIAKEISKVKNVKAIYLFGSYANNKNRVLSDIDICIIGELTENQKIKVMEFSSDNLDISFFDELPIYIKFKIFKEGKPLIIKDKIFIYKTKLRTLQNYLDFKPLINKYIREVLNV